MYNRRGDLNLGWEDFLFRSLQKKKWKGNERCIVSLLYYTTYILFVGFSNTSKRVIYFPYLIDGNVYYHTVEWWGLQFSSIPFPCISYTPRDNIEYRNIDSVVFMAVKHALCWWNFNYKLLLTVNLWSCWYKMIPTWVQIGPITIVL